MNEHNPMTNEELRKEWIKYCDEEGFYPDEELKETYTSSYVADWWLQKLEQARKEEREKIGPYTKEDLDRAVAEEKGKIFESVINILHKSTSAWEFSEFPNIANYIKAIKHQERYDWEKRNSEINKVSFSGHDSLPAIKSRGDGK